MISPYSTLIPLRLLLPPAFILPILPTSPPIVFALPRTPFPASSVKFKNPSSALPQYPHTLQHPAQQHSSLPLNSDRPALDKRVQFPRAQRAPPARGDFARAPFPLPCWFFLGICRVLLLLLLLLLLPYRW